jgi:hypothetical protein
MYEVFGAVHLKPILWRCFSMALVTYPGSQSHFLVTALVKDADM